jgi:hypothetical protein
MVKPKMYRDFIDAMADECNNGQGQVYSVNILSGIWNVNAEIKKLREKNDDLKEQYKMGLILKNLSDEERKILIKMFEGAFQAGVFETLAKLEEFEIEPFIEGYNGSPYDDFIGRVAKDDPWDWPDEK